MQIWTGMTASIDIDDTVFITLEGQLRWTDNASRLGQVVVRPGVGYRLGENTTIGAGYAYSGADPVGPAQTNEHRLWQQATYRLAGDGRGLTLTGRTRIEQRWMEGASDMGWRFRQQLRATAPVSGRVRAVVSSELFIAPDDTSWGQVAGLDRWRNSVGLAVPLGRSITLEPAYLNQRVFRPGPDRVNHIANFTLSARF